VSSSSASADYVLGGTQTEQTRLQSQAHEYEPQARWLLDEIAIRPGSRALDVGCGPIGILGLLSERVGHQGEVVGLEREARFAEMAGREVSRRGLGNVRIVEGDALASRLDRESFDLVHERLVMVNVPERRELLGQMLSLTVRGGTIALEDIDNVSWLCEPPHDSWDVLIGLFHDVLRAGGGDPFIGRRLPGLLREAGALDVRTKVHTGLPEPGQYRRTHLLSILESTRDKVITMGLMDAPELDAHRSALAEHLADPRTVVMDKLLVQCWGSKPP
jgi:SAM-dependent methyltransferase